MNYEKIYKQIVERAKNRVLDCYTERHHIIPRCMGGSDEKENLVRLTAREHYICHWLLYLIYPNDKKIKHAFWMMCNTKSNNQNRAYAISSRYYESVKKEISEMKSNVMKGRGNHNFGKPVSEERKKKWKITYGDKSLGINNPMFDKRHSDETKKVLSKLKLGKKRSEDSIRKQKESIKSRVLITCPYCDLTAKKSPNMTRYHFNNCKQNKNVENESN